MQTLATRSAGHSALELMISLALLALVGAASLHMPSLLRAHTFKRFCHDTGTFLTIAKIAAASQQEAIEVSWRGSSFHAQGGFFKSVHRTPDSSIEATISSGAVQANQTISFYPHIAASPARIEMRLLERSFGEPSCTVRISLRGRVSVSTS
jgi:Tfp pilus assembly protein FimT